MGALVFAIILGGAVIFGAHVCVTVALGKARNKGVLAAIAESPSIGQHFFTGALYIVFSYFIYRYTPVFGEHLHPQVFDFRPGVLYPFFMSEESRTAIFGSAIASAAYFWFWDRRVSADRLNLARAAFAQANNSTPFEELKANLRRTVGRAEPAALIFVALLLVAVTVTEFPGVLRAFDTKFDASGSVTLRLRAPGQGDSAIAQSRYVTSSNGADPSSTSASGLFASVGARPVNDLLSICALFFWSRDFKTERAGAALIDKLEKMPSRQDCLEGIASKSVDHEKYPNEVWSPLRDVLGDIATLVERKNDAHKAWVGAGLLRDIARCAIEAADRRIVGFDVRHRLKPMVVAYAKLLRSLEGGPDPFEWSKESDAALREWLASVDLFFSDSTVFPPAPDDCASIRESVKENVKDSMPRVAGVVEKLICETPAENASRFNSTMKPLCDAIGSDRRLPYARLTLAGLLVVVDEPHAAVLVIDDWLDKSGTSGGSGGGVRAVSTLQHGAPHARHDWLRYIVVYYRENILLKDLSRFTEARFPHLRSVRDNEAAERLLRNFAPNFPELSSVDPKICGYAGVSRIVLLLALHYESNHILLDQYLRRMPPAEREAAFRDGTIQRLYVETVKRFEFEKCAVESGLIPKDLEQVERIGLMSSQVDYRVALAEFLESPAGRALAFKQPENEGPKQLRRAARDGARSALGLVQYWRHRCSAPPSQEQSPACDYSLRLTADLTGAEKTERILASSDAFRSLELRLTGVLVRLQTEFASD